MRFFSKIVLICNLCFIAFAVLRHIEVHKPHTGTPGAIIPLPFVEGTIAVLGYFAIIFNAVFLITAIAMKSLRRKWTFPVWLFWLNLFIFLLQFYFITFYNG